MRNRAKRCKEAWPHQLDWRKPVSCHLLWRHWQTCDPLMHLFSCVVEGVSETMWRPSWAVFVPSLLLSSAEYGVTLSRLLHWKADWGGCRKWGRK